MSNNLDKDQRGKTIEHGNETPETKYESFENMSNRIYGHQIYAASHVLRIPTHRNPITWSLPNLQSSTLAHHVVKERLAGS